MFALETGCVCYSLSRTSWYARKTRDDASNSMGACYDNPSCTPSSTVKTYLQTYRTLEPLIENGFWVWSLALPQTSVALSAPAVTASVRIQQELRLRSPLSWVHLKTPSSAPQASLRQQAPSSHSSEQKIRLSFTLAHPLVQDVWPSRKRLQEKVPYPWLALQAAQLATLSRPQPASPRLSPGV